jgi:tRNA U54 and U55 pseudouridine synthase Pus10
MRHTPKRPGPVEDYLGKPCAWCGDQVDEKKDLSLVVVERSKAWEVFHAWCVEARLESEMSKLLGGR